MARKKRKKQGRRGACMPSSFGAGQPYRMPFYHASGGNMSANLFSALFGSLSSKLPPLITSILQWLTGNDGETLTDKTDPLVVNPEPDVTGVNCLSFDGVNDYVNTNVQVDNLTSFDISIWSGYHSGAYIIGNNGIASSGFLLWYNTDKYELRLGRSAGTYRRISFTTAEYTTSMHLFRITYDGVSSVKLYIDGVEKATTTDAGIVPDSGLPIQIGREFGNYGAQTAGMLSVEVGGILRQRLPIQEGSGLPQDVSGNGNPATVNTATWVQDTSGVLYSYNGEHGFFAAVQGVAPYIPALADGLGLATNGLALTNLGGYVHNRSEVDTVQTDPDETIFGGANIYGDAVTWASLGITDWDAHVNGTNNVWVQWEKVNGVCHVKEVIAYDVTLSLNPAQYNQALNWAQKYTDECGNGVVAASKAIALAGGELIQLAGGEQIELS